MNLTKIITDTDHVQGKASAPITLLEYADYECPYCGQAYYVVKKIQKELGDDLKFVFRNFPIPQLHPHAIKAAIAAEAAAAQGKFWEMHDILFENQRYLSDLALLEYARKIKLDIKQFEEDFNKERFFQKVKDDYDSGIENEVNGTPAFFINEEVYTGNWMEPEFINYIKSLR